ncbi:parB-like partition protein [Dethiosulfovibrio peptidovorans DSM 11002]|uniref:ParB-like partition protein n=1 Tax=Dethiosulfovibrio peptidovorans DSM 11002 TaxID=469381 RepID=D2Z693_9BACT|nr:ParB/RepB/Spo0J family partition protein [Dethiosulfovibrio peptidovorans]EFC90990.1 parB-like partition protein [Dethiosulfovibrio peptidovorans DSM 11002]
MAQRRSLGKGLDALLPKDVTPSIPKTLPVKELKPNPDQPRKDFDEEGIRELAASIKVHGILQPLLVTKKDGGYMIVAGERRWRAAREAGIKDVPVHLFDGDDGAILEVSLVENVQREDLSPVEVAMSLKELMDRFSLSQDNLAEKVGWSRPAVANKLRLLKLPTEVLGLISEGALSERHGRALLSLDTIESTIKMGKAAAEKGWTVRELERKIAESTEEIPQEKRKKRTPSWGDDLSPYDVGVSMTGRGNKMKLILSGLNKVQIERIGEILSRESDRLFPGK